MKDGNELRNQISKEVNSLQKKIDHVSFYNIRNKIVKSFIKSALALDYIFPYILAMSLILYGKFKKGDDLLFTGKVKEYLEIQTIDTSSGIHLEHQSYDLSYYDDVLEHSTGWIINENGFYERTVTSYRLSDPEILSEPEKVLSMTKEEVEDLFEITNIHVIQKSSLTAEDEIYQTDALIVSNYQKSQDDFIERKIELDDALAWMLAFNIKVFLEGFVFQNMKKHFLGNYVKDQLIASEVYFEPINETKLRYIKELLEKKQETLSMLDPSLENQKKTYQLRKDSR